MKKTFTEICRYLQCCSCLFASGRTVVYRSHYTRPQFPPKVGFVGPNYRLQASHVASHVDWPSRTLLMIRPALQDAVLLRCMTTTALDICTEMFELQIRFRICIALWCHMTVVPRGTGTPNFHKYDFKKKLIKILY